MQAVKGPFRVREKDKPTQENDNNIPNPPARTNPDFELLTDVCRSIAKIFNNFLINEGKQSPQTEVLSEENEQKNND
jgi:hypothetical protein